MLSQVYQYYDDSPLIILGDVNGRIGDLQDFNVNIDTIPNRVPLDTVRNSFGDALIEFLKDAKMCVLNGRGDPKLDNYTFISPRGKSVVDYMVTPYSQLTSVSNFHVQSVSELLRKFDIRPGTAKIPDHSVITCVLNLSCYETLQNETDATNTENLTLSYNDQPTFRKYDVRNVPQDILSDDISVEAIERLIHKLENENITQREIDAIYTSLVDVIHTEMDNNLNYRDIRAGAKKRKRYFTKPWWSQELKVLWDNVREAENIFLKCKDNRNKRSLRSDYVAARKKFDKLLRQNERQYYSKQREDLCNFQTQNPKEFWSRIKKLGPGNKQQTFDSVLMDEGSESRDPEEILKKWKSDFSKSFSLSNGDFDDNFLTETRITLQRWENELENYDRTSDNGEIQSTRNDDLLNCPISLEEINRVLSKAKSGKAVGIENIPNEILKCDKFVPVLHMLFSACFEHNMIPSLWYKTIIQHVLKRGKDSRDPSNYRGISLMSTIAKLFSGILNDRICSYLDENGLLCEEQNGFRKLRSCLDHLYTLITVIRNRKEQNMQTFLCFVDFAKAFDSVNRDCLLYKLRNIGVNGKIYNIIKSLYWNIESTVRVDNRLTDWFSVYSGVRQGDNLAPTLFAIYVDDVTTCINQLNVGVPISETDSLSILLYADDIVLMAQNAEDLQKMINALHEWTFKWRLSVNTQNTQVMHVRKHQTRRSDYTFRLGDNLLRVTEPYRYLGLHINEFINSHILLLFCMMPVVEHLVH